MYLVFLIIHLLLMLFKMTLMIQKRDLILALLKEKLSLEMFGSDIQPEKRNLYLEDLICRLNLASLLL